MDENPENSPSPRWAERLIRPLRVMAHTQAQLDFFRHSYGIPARVIRRVMRQMDLVGVATDQPLILLPGYDTDNPDAGRMVTEWRWRGGNFIELTDAVVEGKKPLCGNDTDGDGDCHLCAKRGGCPWPNSPAK